MFSTKARIKLRIVILFVFPFLLWILPANFFDNGKIVMCFSKWYLGIECLGCGMTRAIMHFHHFDFDTAFQFNRGVIFWYPVLVFIWGYWIRKFWSEIVSK